MFWSPILLAIVVAILLALTFGCDRSDDQRTSEYRNQGKETATAPADVRSDKEFLTTAAKANLTEIEAGRLAESKGSIDDVKSFGRQMVDDHSATNASLTELARKKGIELPTRADDDERSRLEGLSGADFDRKYAAWMVQEHEKAVALFQKYAKSAKDEDVGVWAERTLPTLQHHLKMARDLKAKVGEPTAD